MTKRQHRWVVKHFALGINIVGKPEIYSFRTYIFRHRWRARLNVWFLNHIPPGPLGTHHFATLRPAIPGVDYDVCKTEEDLAIARAALET